MNQAEFETLAVMYGWRICACSICQESREISQDARLWLNGNKARQEEALKQLLGAA